MPTPNPLHENWRDELENIGTAETSGSWATNSRENLVNFIESVLSSYRAALLEKVREYVSIEQSDFDIGFNVGVRTVESIINSTEI